MECREGGLTEDAVGLVSAAPDWPLAGILLGLDLVQEGASQEGEAAKTCLCMQNAITEIKHSLRDRV